MCCCCSGREARNRAEKNRRDRLNGCIQELSTLVPHVAESTRRVDKIAVLRFATHGLRLKHGNIEYYNKLFLFSHTIIGCFCSFWQERSLWIPLRYKLSDETPRQLLSNFDL